MNKLDLKLSDSKWVRYFKSFVLLQGKHIGFYGNFGQGDIGDDTVFLVVQKLLEQKVLPFSKRCYAFNPRALKALLLGGGGILRWECPYIPNKLLLKPEWDFPVFLLSAGINCDYHKEFSEESKDKIKKICEQSEYISVRDKVTERFIKDLGFSNIKFFPDLELMLDPEPVKINIGEEKPIIGIVLSPHSEFSSGTIDNINDSFVEFTDYLTEQGFKVIYFLFDYSTDETTREHILVQSILQKIRFRENVIIVGDEFSPQQKLFVMKKYCHSMVCLRLHSAIYALNAEVPFFCVGYNMMHKAFMEILNLEQLEIPIFEKFNPATLIDKFQYMQENHDKIKDVLTEKRNSFREIICSEVKNVNGILSKI